MFEPKFVINNRILTNIAKIEAAKEIITDAPLVPAWEEKFRQEAILRTVHHGTHIEGNPLDQKEVADILQGKDVEGRQRDIQEILNYREVLKFIDKYPDSSLIEEATILKIHKITVNTILPGAESGHYRLVQVAVRNSVTGEISYMAPGAKEVPNLMHEFLFWLGHTPNEEVHPVLKAGIATYVVNAIHPFVDGNGRTARALATLILFKEGYETKKFFSLEEYYDRDAKRYYDNLQKVSKSHQQPLYRDITPWLEYFTEGLMVEFQRIKEKVKRLSVDIKLKGKVGQIALNERQIKLVEFMETNVQIKNIDWRHLLPMVSDDTILRDLKDLMKKRLVKKKGSTKAAVYVLR